VAPAHDKVHIVRRSEVNTILAIDQPLTNLLSFSSTADKPKYQ
jgi:hypothetical protein